MAVVEMPATAPNSSWELGCNFVTTVRLPYGRRSRMTPRNDSRILIVGVWFAILADTNYRLTTLCYKSLRDENAWEVKEVLVDSKGKLVDRSNSVLSSVTSAEDVIDYITALFNIYVERQLVTKVLTFTPVSDSEDIYDRIFDVYKAFGISLKPV
jgi:hypothetical protein